MRIIKLNATHSTNDYLRELSSKNVLEDFTCVVTKEQTKGKGQLGSRWESESGENLTFSVFKTHLDLHIEEQFLISMISALAIYNVLKDLNLKRIFIKWPNDILAEDKKLCGILIENTVKRSVINSSIIGIGLNVNQTNFDKLPKASSLKNVLGKSFFLDEVMLQIIYSLKAYFLKFKAFDKDVIVAEFNEVLFRKNKPSMFEVEGSVVVGIIKSVSLNGQLLVAFEDEVLKSFSLKEIKHIY